MGLFSKRTTTTEPAATPAPAVTKPAGGVSLQKASGKVNLSKGQAGVIIEKTPLITASVSWRSGTDYDVYALVMMRDGTQVDVAAFPAAGVPAKMQHEGVRHTGDVTRPTGSAEQVETIEIKFTPDVLAVVPVAYSAQSNGTGSFRRFQVTLTIDNHSGTQVTVDAKNANDNDKVYTCVPGVIRQTAEGVAIEPLEAYSKAGSENRPAIALASDGTIDVTMDRGPKNKYK